MEISVFGHNHRCQHALGPYDICTATPTLEATLAVSRKFVSLRSNSALSHIWQFLLNAVYEHFGCIVLYQIRVVMILSAMTDNYCRCFAHKLTCITVIIELDVRHFFIIVCLFFSFFFLHQVDKILFWTVFYSCACHSWKAFVRNGFKCFASNEHKAFNSIWYCIRSANYSWWVLFYLLV